VRSDPRLPFDAPEVALSADLAPADLAPADLAPPADAEARRHATDPAQNVALEASAGTGKTRVLVDRYVNLLAAGVDPGHILAVTFTRKAAAEMRRRIIDRLREASRTSEKEAARWRDLRGRLGDIGVSTFDAFCLSLIREFPLEAGVDPGFDLADETEIPRLMDEAIDAALRIGRSLARTEADLAMLLVQLGEQRLRLGLAALLERRLVARDLLRSMVEAAPRDLTIPAVCRRASEQLRSLFSGIPGGIVPFLEAGPVGHPQFAMLAADLARLCRAGAQSFHEAAAFRALVDRIRAYFLTQDGRPRTAKGFGQSEFKKDHCRSDEAWRGHRGIVEGLAPAVLEAVTAFRRDLNVVLSRGVWRMFNITTAQYVRTLESHSVLDFAEVLSRALDLLRQMDEFSRSRYKLEARYRHLLVDEFQDTSRAQWELVSLLVRSWGEGSGASDDALPPSIFLVGDRKQSIYGFRDADLSVLEDAARFIERLRPSGRPRRAITVSFRARQALLAFINDVFGEIGAASGESAKHGVGVPPDRRADGFRYDEGDRFPLDRGAASGQTFGAEPRIDRSAVPCEEPVEFLAAPTLEAAADRVAGEIASLLARGAPVRDRQTGVTRPVAAGDIAVIFRARDSHRAYEAALEQRGVPAYVYKGLGFFEADEIQDLLALLRLLAEPTSDLRAAAFMRSRLVRLSDQAIATLAPRLTDALTGPEASLPLGALADEDRKVLLQIRASLPRWLESVDMITPGELLQAVLRDSAYAFEMRGPHRQQARENVKKLRALVRRIQNRGYATLARIADHLERLALGDEANAVIDAFDAVNLMTVHAAKGLEFPVVFVVDLGRGVGGPRPPIRALAGSHGEPCVAVGDFESEADEDAAARDREETKRLLYVALTRARDRLYLSAVVKDGVFKPGRGSLGDVLPRFVVERLERAMGRHATDQQVVTCPASTSGSR
jgi:ATP-dependent helicase/nuclease subunit A